MLEPSEWRGTGGRPRDRVVPGRGYPAIRSGTTPKRRRSLGFSGRAPAEVLRENAGTRLPGAAPEIN